MTKKSKNEKDLCEVLNSQPTKYQLAIITITKGQM